MRTIDLYRGQQPPCHEFDPYPNPEYQATFAEATAAMEELAKYNVPEELIQKIDSVHSKLSSIELDLMWCFAFEKGMAFQKNLGATVKDFDISVK